MTEKLLQDIIQRLDRGDSPDSRWPDDKGEYWALCPFHADQQAANFSVSVRGFKCFSCGEDGGLGKLAEKVGFRPSGVLSGGYTHTRIVTIESYAKAKRLPLDFLASLGVATVRLKGGDALSIPYYDQEGQETAARYRVALTGKDCFRWRRGSRLIPYGLWKLATIQKGGYVLLVEGESDTQTLWRHGLPGLGIPGANVWRKEWAKLLDGLTVYVRQEPDQGGAAFVEKIGESLPEARIMQPPSDRKDISECHILGEDVPQIVRDAMASARPWSKIRAERLAREAQEAKQEAKELLECPNILDRFAKLCRGLGLVADKRTAGLLYLSLTSRVLRKPVSVAVKGPSSGGKSETVRIVLLAFPTNTYYAFTSMSERALVYDEEPLAHRFVVLYEAAGLNSRLATYIIRSLLTEGCLDYLTVEKTPEGLRPRRIHRDGPTGLILTTTRAKLQGEFETRLLSVTVRDDPKQTLGVFHSLADADNNQGPATPDLAPWCALQRWIELAGDREVAIPFGHALADLTDPTAVRMRRDFAALLSLVKARAILHQTQRERDAQGRIVATIEDYRAVHDLVADLVSQGVRATVSKETRQTVEAVARLYEETSEWVTVAQLREELDLGNSATTRRTAVAREGGCLQNMEDRRGRPLKLKVGDPLPDEASVFPTPELLEDKACVCVPIPPGIDRKAGSPSHRERESVLLEGAESIPF